MAPTQTTINNKRLTLVVNASAREKEPNRSRWTIQYEFKLWRFGAYQEVQTFNIGPDAVPFTLHTNLLRERCPTFYDELLQEDGKDATPKSDLLSSKSDLLGDISPCPIDRPFDIRSLSVGLFRVFSAWLYTGQLVLPDENASRPRPVTRLVAKQAHKTVEASGSWRDEDLIDVYMFASRHEVWELANLAITRLWTQNDKHCRTTALPAIEKVFAAGCFGWDDTLGGSGPSQKPYLMRLQDYLLFEGAHRLEDIKDSWLDLMLTAHLYPPPYNRAVHTRYHEPPRAIVKTHGSGRDRPFWQYDPCHFHCHASKEDQKPCHARNAKSVDESTVRPVQPPRPVVGPTIHRLLRGTCTVLLGRGQVPFTLHKELACYHSGFFYETFGDSWHGPPNDQVVLLREQPRDFALFASWLYSAEICLPTIQEERMGDILIAPPRTPKGKEREEFLSPPRSILRSPKGKERARRSVEAAEDSSRDSGIDVSPDSDTSGSSKTDSTSGDDNDDDDDSADSNEITPATCAREPEPEKETNEARFLVRKHQQDLIHLYAFAVRMKIPSLRNAVMDKFVEQRESGHPYASSLPENLRLAYQLNLPNSLLCNYLIQEAAFTFRGLPRDRSGYAQLLPPQFLHDLLEYQFTRGIFPKLREHTPSWRVNLCEFHEHATEHDASACTARNAEWQEALKKKGSTWEPVRKELQSLARSGSGADAKRKTSTETNAVDGRLERTPTPRGTSSRTPSTRRRNDTPSVAGSTPTSPTLPNRPPPTTPLPIPNRASNRSTTSIASTSSSISVAEIQPNMISGSGRGEVANARFDRTPTPRGRASFSRRDPAALESPTVPTRPLPVPNRASSKIRASVASDVSAISVEELQLTPQPKRLTSESASKHSSRASPSRPMRDSNGSDNKSTPEFRKDSVLPTLELDFGPSILPRTGSISSEDETTPPSTPIKDIRRKSAPPRKAPPPVPPKPPYEDLEALQRSLPPIAGQNSSSNRSSNRNTMYGDSLSYKQQQPPSPTTATKAPPIKPSAKETGGRRRQGIDVFEYRSQNQSHPDLTITPPSVPAAPLTIIQPKTLDGNICGTEKAKAVHFSRHRVAARVSKLTTQMTTRAAAGMGNMRSPVTAVFEQQEKAEKPPKVKVREVKVDEVLSEEGMQMLL